MPTSLIYNKTARVMRCEESKLARIADPFQAIAARNFPSDQDRRDWPRMSKDKQTAPEMRCARSCEINDFPTFNRGLPR